MNNNIFIFTVEKKYVRVRLLSPNDEVMSNVTIDFSFREKIYTKITDSEGFCIFDYDEFIPNEKMKVAIHEVTTKKNGKIKEKIIKKTIKILTEKEHQINQK